MQVLRSLAPVLGVNLRDRRLQPPSSGLSVQPVRAQLQACQVHLPDERMPVHGRSLHVQRQALRSQAFPMQAHYAVPQPHHDRSQPHGPVLSVQHARPQAPPEGFHAWLYCRCTHNNWN